MSYSLSEEKERTLYGWAFYTGQQLLKRLNETYGDTKRAEKHMMTFLLNLRSELLPEKFRRELVNIIIEVQPTTSFPKEIKEERSWRVDEFYRYSSAILAAFFDALQSWKKESTKEGGEQKCPGEPS